jgi:oligoribonuclease
MRYVSIDIETTGLDPKVHDVVEIGAVIDDTTAVAPLEKLPIFHCYVVKDNYVTDPYCAFMHQSLFLRIADRKKYEGEYLFLHEHEVMPRFVHWLLENGFSKEGCVVPKFTPAGKNFGSFDLQFLNNKFDFSNHVRCHHRILDPAVLYFNPTVDIEVPNMQTCLERAGIDEQVAHTGVDDAMQVVKLIRNIFSKG